MAIARLPCALIMQYIRLCPLHSFAVPGAAGHNRGEAAERQPLARTQGRNLDRGFTFKPTPCVGCPLTPEGETSAHNALGACDRVCGRRGTAAYSSRSVQHYRERRPESRPKAHEG